MLHTDFIKHLEHTCSELENKPVSLRAYEKIYGGDVNEAYRLAMTDKDYFIKVNSKDRMPMFETEAESLIRLTKTYSFRIPVVYEVGEYRERSYLLMEYIEHLEDVSNPHDFAEKLVTLHKNTQDQYGLDFDNYIGSLPQYNGFKNNWIDFFRENRLRYQINLASQKGLIPDDILHKFDHLLNKLPNFLIEEQPSFLHGDLWNGNYFYDMQGKAVIFDPAIYYGHREVDIAMMSLFGGFDPKIYSIYNELYPMEKGWKARLKIYQLYPLLVHLNLFGESYLISIEQILNSF
jgi:fructosamine-3-kinase